MKRLRQVHESLVVFLICFGILNRTTQAQLVPFEAESGTLGADWNVVVGAPTYVTIKTDLAGEAPTNVARVATYTITFPAAGTYNLFGRLQVGSGPFSSDSFYYGNGFGNKSPTASADWITCNKLVDCGFTGLSDIVTGVGGSALGNVWKWINLSDYTGASGETPVTFTVPAGNLIQTFQLGGRQKCLFDKFAFGATGTLFSVSNLDNGTLPTSSAAPVRIMAVGDSITDDCSIDGAWRKPLQLVLDAGGFQFTFVGRQTSTSATGFTKRLHEGYCGATIASPGIINAHQYSMTQNCLLQIVPDALVANPNPDVMLIHIGANDMSSGRDPLLVVTNQMATLLDMIFSIAPNTQVVLAKATRQESYNAQGGANMPIYNAAIQALANQRRALGQKIQMADLFSTVTYPANFSDNLHPNAAGLQQAADEWASRLQTIMPRPNFVGKVLINGGAIWKYNDQGQDLGTNWAQVDYDDSAWSNGVARLGYGDPTVATTVSFGPQSTNKNVTTYFRIPFVVPANVIITNLNLRVARADGVVILLNGQEIYRTNLPAGIVTYTNLALSAVTYILRHIFNPANVPVNLRPGTNWIAAEVHLSSATAAAMGFDMELIGTGYPVLPPSLSIAAIGENNVKLSWPLSNGSTFSLYSSTNLNAADAWSPVETFIQTNGGQLLATQWLDSPLKFFRLQQP